jgi:hypothetical protein
MKQLYRLSQDLSPGEGFGTVKYPKRTGCELSNTGFFDKVS